MEAIQGVGSFREFVKKHVYGLFEDNFFCVVDRRVVIWVAVEVRVVDIGVGGSAG